MKNLYWVERSADQNCGHRGTIPKELKRSEKYRSTKDYFRGRGGEPGLWDIDFQANPCDISMSPFVYMVSEKFKIVAESLGIEANFHSVQVRVAGEPINIKYYLPQPSESLEFIDLTSPRVKSTDVGHVPAGWPTPYGSIQYDSRHSHVHYDAIGEKHWVTHPNATGSPWIISEAFKQEIEKQNLTNFRFVRALEALNK